MIDARVATLLDAVGLAPSAGIDAEIVGRDPVLASPYPVGEAAATVLGAVGVAAATLWHDATGAGQSVTVHTRRAAASIHAHRTQLLDGQAVPSVPWKPVVGFYRTADDRFVALNGPFPHLIDGTLEVLGCANDDGAIADAVARWRADELEDAMADAGQCGAIARTAAEWQAHEQGKLLAELGPVAVERIGDGPRRAVPSVGSPLGGVRVLDLTRVLAGPVHGRHLADLGADVLLVNSPRLVNVQDSLVETGHGKRSALLDLDDPADTSRLHELAADADVFADGYRGGALEARGFSAEALAAANPGIIRVSINCYGDVGEWRGRRGFEPIAQAAAGLALATAADGRPGRLPGTVCDYLTGCLATLGTLVALRRRADVGGSYRVRASLAQTAMWLEAMGTTSDPEAATGFGDLGPWQVHETTAFGHLEHLLPPIGLSSTPARWWRTAVPPGTDPPEWPPRG